MSNKENTIPRSLNECTHTGKTVSDLYGYAQNLEKSGKWLFFIIAIISIFSTVFEGIAAADVDEELIIPTVISELLPGLIYAIIALIACQIAAMLVRALAAITKSTMISANVALYEASQKETDNESETQAPATPPSETIIESKPVEKSENPTVPKEAVKVENGSWICPGCGQRNISGRTSCWRCDYQL